MSKKIIILLFVSLLSLNLSAQNKLKHKKAQKYFSQVLDNFYSENYNQALALADKVLSYDSTFIDARKIKAQIYSDMGKYDSVLFELNKISELDTTDKDVIFFYGIAFMNKEQFKKAIDYFEKYIALTGKNDERYKNAVKKISLCKFRDSLINNPLDYKFYRLDNRINTTQAEYFPTISAYDEAIVFTRLCKQDNFMQEDIYISRENNNEYQTAINISPYINTVANEGAHCLSADGMTMIFTRCAYNGGCDLYVSHKDESGFWMPPQKLPAPVNTRYWETQPSLSPDGKTLYFVSNRPGGKGGMDIWMTKFLGNAKWSKPVNLNINTKGNEMSPFLHYDAQTLYFASDFYPGMGKFDIFKCKKINDSTFSNVVNLGYPLNTKSDEFRMVVAIDGKNAYYSTEKDTVYKQDIYKIEMPSEVRPEPTIYVRVFIYRKPDDAKTDADEVSIVNLKTKDTVYSDKKISEFLTCLPLQNDYALNILKKGYLLYSYNFSLKNIADTLENYDIYAYLNPIAKGATVVLKNLFFQTDSYTINPKSYVELDKVIEFLKTNPSVDVEVAGHTDSIGSYSYNMELSKNRAKAVADYLINGGISPDRIKYKGYGYTEPVAENTTAEGRQKNRRTEIVVLKK